MAIEVINHEFNQTVGSIRQNLTRLKAWADKNPGLNKLYQDLRTAFDHLDGYLTLFTPLHRRLYRNPIEFSGAEIAKFLHDVFDRSLKQDEINLEASQQFLKKRITGYPSTFYPVFVNLIQNSLFWLRDSRPPKTIRLDADVDSFIISDTGPGIPSRDREAIFDLGFTRKPGGRGFGLYISRDVLSKIGYSLFLEPQDANGGATFRITPQNNNTGEKEE